MLHECGLPLRVSLEGLQFHLCKTVVTSKKSLQ